MVWVCGWVVYAMFGMVLAFALGVDEMEDRLVYGIALIVLWPLVVMWLAILDRTIEP